MTPSGYSTSVFSYPGVLVVKFFDNNKQLSVAATATAATTAAAATTVVFTATRRKLRGFARKLDGRNCSQSGM